MPFNSIHKTLLLVLFMAPTFGQDALLRWHNGDVLSGTLLPSESGQVRWSSPVFSDAVVVDTHALASISFPKQSVQGKEAFRIGTVAGDVFIADLVGSSENSFVFSSQRHGRFQVPWDFIYSFRRIANPNLVFVGARFEAWQHAMDGPIRHLSTKVFQGNWGWGTPLPDLEALTPVHTARFPAGYLDLGLSRFQEKFAMSFQGDILIPTTGEYRFEGAVDDEAHVWIDGKKMRNQAEIAFRYDSVVTLTRGSHTLRLDYIDLGGEAHLSLWMVNAGGEYTSLAQSNPTSGWYRGVGGHPQTQRKKASLFCGVELPNTFEIDLELASSRTPQFVLAIGKGKPRDESNQSLRLETWADELVVVQNTTFEPVMTLAKDRRELRLQLAYDTDSRTLQVFDASGILLTTVEDVRADTGQSSITLRNRGEDLSVRRLSVYRRSSANTRQTFDAARPRVHLMDGQVVYGRLHAEEGALYVVDQAGTRRDIDLDQVDRIARPGAKLAVTGQMTEVSYADGTVMRGQIEQANLDYVTLHTAFSDTRVTCALSGASQLRFDTSAVTKTPASGEAMDQLFTTAGRLRGRLSFDLPESPLSWYVPGAVQPLRLVGSHAVGIERNSESVTPGPAFDKKTFPCVLYLRNGEIMPCRILSYDKDFLGFHSPFVTQRKLDSIHMKAIVFAPARGPDPVKLARALTVPRFSRDSPASHILIAKNGDLKRGRLLSLSAQTIGFESKLRKQAIPADRMASVVNVNRQQDLADKTLVTTTDLTGLARATLTDGSILIFEALEVRDGKLLGRSALYGDMAIPTDSIQALSLGGFEKAPSKSLFEAWVVRPAQEPAFGHVTAPHHDP